MSVSVPFFVRSVQLAGAQTFASQTPLSQSASRPQAIPEAHFFVVAHAPPQSTPLSSPFLMPSVHVGAAQTFEVHTPLSQSAATAHPRPLAHVELGAQEPPQSTSVSFPFFS